MSNCHLKTFMFTGIGHFEYFICLNTHKHSFYNQYKVNLGPKKLKNRSYIEPYCLFMIFQISTFTKSLKIHGKKSFLDLPITDINADVLGLGRKQFIASCLNFIDIYWFTQLNHKPKT